MLHNEELHNLYAAPYTTRAIKSRTMRWASHIEHIGGEKCLQNAGQEI
jgi:hypothetical protein